jgi:NAD+ diphosphatase
MTFISAVTPPLDNQRPSLWFIFQGFRLLVYQDDQELPIPILENPSTLALSSVRTQYLGYLERGGITIQCCSAEVEASEQRPEGMEFVGLRRLFNRLDEEILAVAGRAIQIIDWDRTHQFCGQCGSDVVQLGHERAKQCTNCGHTSYPRISPAVIVSIERQGETGKELLLARNHRHPKGFFSVLAGFVEPGESLEECVRREVREEVAIEVDNIRYFGSQSWPFPNSLMIAFTAEYAGGHIQLEEEELAEAGWFAAKKLPPVPPKASIARQMIDAFTTRNSDTNETIQG